MKKELKITPDIVVDTDSWFYKNCKKQRIRGAKICQCCPFRKQIELKENEVKEL